MSNSQKTQKNQVLLITGLAVILCFSAFQNPALSDIPNKMYWTTFEDNTMNIILYQPEGDSYVAAALAEIKGRVLFDYYGFISGEDTFLRLGTKGNSDRWVNITSSELVKGRIVITTRDEQVWTIYNPQISGLAAMIMPGRFLDIPTGTITPPEDGTATCALHMPDGDGDKRVGFLEFEGEIEFDASGIIRIEESLLKVLIVDDYAAEEGYPENWENITETTLVSGRAVITTEDGDTWTIYGFQDYGVAMIVEGEAVEEPETESEIEEETEPLDGQNTTEVPE